MWCWKVIEPPFLALHQAQRRDASHRSLVRSSPAPKPHPVVFCRSREVSTATLRSNKSTRQWMLGHHKERGGSRRIDLPNEQIHRITSIIHKLPMRERGRHQEDRRWLGLGRSSFKLIGACYSLLLPRQRAKKGGMTDVSSRKSTGQPNRTLANSTKPVVIISIATLSTTSRLVVALLHA